MPEVPTIEAVVSNLRIFFSLPHMFPLFFVSFLHGLIPKLSRTFIITRPWQLLEKSLMGFLGTYTCLVPLHKSFQYPHLSPSDRHFDPDKS